MRRIIAAAFISLDGVMQAPGGPEEDPTGGFEHGGWTFHYWDDAMGSAMGETFSKPFDLLLGRKTYDIFAGYWPHQEGGPIADTFNKVAKYVATGSSAPLKWAHSRSLGPDVVAALTQIKKEDGPDLLIQGSSDLVQTLLEAGLIDEFRLLIFPLVLGKGKKLFGSGTVPAALKLTGTRTSSTGVIVANYVPAGAIRTGSFATTEPSADELERRRNLV
jgi:dihydrofolate reductase